METNDNTKKDLKSLENVSRRKAVKKIVGGVSALAAYNMLPVRWEKPIIEQVFLPAHAQTSGVSSPYTLHDPCTLTLISGNQQTSVARVKVDGFVTPPTANLPVTITATPEGGTGGAVTFNTTTDAAGEFTGILIVTGGPGMTRINVQTHVEGSANDAVCALDLGVNPSEPSEPPAPVTYDLTVSASGPSAQCAEDGITYNISGTATASDGSSMDGVEVSIDIEDAAGPTAGPYTLTVQPDGTYSDTFVAIANGGPWVSPVHVVIATFNDQATYGNVTATAPYNCDV